MRLFLQRLGRAVVAAEFCFGALGTDLAGPSAGLGLRCGRLEAELCLVSNRGASLNNFDPLGHVGPLCKTVLDTALLLQGMAGYDPHSAGPP